MIMHAHERNLLVARALRRKDQSGAALVEYALLLFAVLICGAGAIKAIGPSVVCAGQNATDGLGGGLGGGGCGGATASAAGAGGSASGAVGGSGGASAGSGAGGDEAAGTGAGMGSGGGGEVASASSYDDGAGGFIGGSGSSTRMASNSNSGSGGSAGSGSGSGFGSATAGGGGGGGVASSSSDDSSGANGAPSFASQVAGTAPKQIDLTLAKLSKDVYGDKNAKNQKGADGFKPLTKAQLAKAGITQNMLQDKNTGFVADVYTNGKGDYVVAYRGTMMNTWTGWGTDGLQGAGVGSKQYNEGLRLAGAAQSAFGNNVVFTGHSLGGGLADSAAAATGLTAVTFNAAGLSDHTLIANDQVNPAAERAQANNGQMRSYEVKGEILSSLQNEKGSIMPKALGRPIEIADPNPALTAADRKQASLLNPWPALNRSGELHGDYLQGLKAGPVKYKGADGKVDEYSFTNPPHS